MTRLNPGDSNYFKDKDKEEVVGQQDQQMTYSRVLDQNPRDRDIKLQTTQQMNRRTGDNGAAQQRHNKGLRETNEEGITSNTLQAW